MKRISLLQVSFFGMLMVGCVYIAQEVIESGAGTPRPRMRRAVLAGERDLLARSQSIPTPTPTKREPVRLRIAVCGGTIAPVDGYDIHDAHTCDDAYAMNANLSTRFVVEIMDNRVGVIDVSHHLVDGYCGKGVGEEWGIVAGNKRVHCSMPTIAVCGGSIAPIDGYDIHVANTCDEAYAMDVEWVVEMSPAEGGKGVRNIDVKDHLEDGYCGDGWGVVSGAHGKHAECSPRDCTERFPVDVPYDIVDAHYGTTRFQMAVYRQTKDIGDIVSSTIRRSGQWDSGNTHLILSELREDSVFVDIGANIGWFSIVSAMRGHRTYAVEPFHTNLQLLRLSACVNSLANLIIIPYGLGTKNATCELWQIPTVNLGDTHTICNATTNAANAKRLMRKGYVRVGTMQSTTLDALNLPLLHEDVVMKIDVEGYEPYVIGGGPHTMQSTPPRVVLSEFTPSLIEGHMFSGNSGLARRYLEDMREYGYEMLDSKMQRIDRLDRFVAHPTTPDVVFRRLPTNCQVRLRTWLQENVHDAKTFSQNGEDGILGALLSEFGRPDTKYYVEFGTEDGSERNTRLLQEKHGYTGLLMDGSHTDTSINLHQEFITPQNINELFRKYNVPSEFNLLSIDINYDDYWVWKAIDATYRPIIVAIEFNSKLGPSVDQVVDPKDPRRWTGSDYFGASYQAMKRLGASKNYTLVRTDALGINLFFVRNDRIGCPGFDAGDVFRPPNYGPGGRGHPDDTSGRRWIENENVVVERRKLPTRSTILGVPSVLVSDEHWSLWNGETPIPSGRPAHVCRWVTFKVGTARYPMCVHEQDAISNSIAGVGRWPYCDSLTTLWGHDESPGIHFEVGANIGACMMQMLTTTNARIFVFEPNPDNLFCLTSTLLRLDAALRSRVAVFPIGLGAGAAENVVHAAKGNMGNSVVGTVIKDDPHQNFLSPRKISIRSLDEIFQTPPTITLMKMDVQGYECNVLDGMTTLIPHVRLLKTEVSNHWLQPQGCDDKGLFRRLRPHFTITDESNQPMDHPISKWDYDILAHAVSTAPTIPHTMFFTYAHDILATKSPTQFYDNIRHTIDAYRGLWGEPDAPVRFLDDDACRAVIERVEPKLVPHFDKETQGMYKADVCRVAALYDEGGYYFDVDIAVIEPLALDADVGFATAFEPQKTNFFQAFIAAAPRHPILKEALRIMLAYYEGTHKLHGWMGTSTLKDAHDAVPEDQRGPIRWLHEGHLKPREYPELTRQKGTGCCCNYVVHDETEHKPYFWSRIVGSSHC